MGTSDSYSGGGGKPARDINDSISDWLDSLPSAPPSAPSEPGDASPPEGVPSGTGDDVSPVPELKPEVLLPVIGLFRRRSGGRSDGPSGAGGLGLERAQGSGGRRGGGAQRSAARSAGSAGRAAAAAYAYRTGDADALQELGLDYDTLRATGDSIEIAHLIVEAACDSSDGTIDTEERRTVAAAVALWVLEENEAGAPPEPDEIARFTLAEILFEAMSAESAAKIRDGKRPAWASAEGQRQIRRAAETLAQRAELSATGATAAELERAIEQGLETLRAIWSDS